MEALDAHRGDREFILRELEVLGLVVVEPIADDDRRLFDGRRSLQIRSNALHRSSRTR